MELSWVPLSTPMRPFSFNLFGGAKPVMEWWRAASDVVERMRECVAAGQVGEGAVT